MNDVAAVPALVAADETDERRDDVGAGRAAPHVGAADELLNDRSSDERAQPEAQARDPQPNPEGEHSGQRDGARHSRPHQLLAQVAQ